MATLGELLFYFANCDAQPHPERTWPQAAAIVRDVARLLGADEDAVTRHYAAKAIDNMMTVHDFWAAQFRTDSVALALLEVSIRRSARVTRLH